MAQVILATILSALYTVVGFLVRSVLVKFFIFFALWFVTTEFIDVLQRANILPTANALSGAFRNIPPGVWYWLDLFAFSAGAQLLISAYVTRFIIRRIPLIG